MATHPVNAPTSRLTLLCLLLLFVIVVVVVVFIIFGFLRLRRGCRRISFILVISDDDIVENGATFDLPQIEANKADVIK